MIKDKGIDSNAHVFDRKRCNRYSTGYVIIPVIEACKKNRVFDFLENSGPVTEQKFKTELNLTFDFTYLIFDTLLSLNWIKRNESGKYLLNDVFSCHKTVPDQIIALYEFNFEEYLLYNKNTEDISSWMEQSINQWGIGNASFSDMLDGVLFLPLLNVISKKKINFTRFFATDAESGGKALELFLSKGWIEKKDDQFYFDENNINVLKKYIPLYMLINNRNFLQNNNCLLPEYERSKAKGNNIYNPRESFSRLWDYINRDQNYRLNSDLEEILLSIFNCEPVDEQPDYVVHIGCGDGTLLKWICDIVLEKSKRGKDENSVPLIFVGIEYDEDLLKKAAFTLANYPCLLLDGDIHDPCGISKLLEKHDINIQKVLPLSLFSNHERNVRFGAEDSNQHIFPADTASALDFFLYDHVVQDWTEYLGKWSGYLNQYGIILSEAHRLSPGMAGKYSDESENFYLNFFYTAKGQYLVKAEDFILAAARSGLFTRDEWYRRYPREKEFTGYTLNYFEKRNYAIRNAVKEDIPVLLELENQCWDKGIRASRKVIEQRIETYPSGHFAVEMDGKVVGVIFSQRIKNAEDLKSKNSDNVPELHDPEGGIIQLLAINISPRYQHMGLGDQLLEFMLQRCAVVTGIVKVTAVTRTLNYADYQHMSFEEFVRHRDEQGRLVDPILRFHELHGAQVKNVIPGYRGKDDKNQGNGIRIEYRLQERKRDRSIELPLKEIAKIKPDFIIGLIKQALGEEKESQFSMDCPLMNMSLDSMDLMLLKDRINLIAHLNLDSTFFFQYNTTRLVLEYLKKQGVLDDGFVTTAVSGEKKEEKDTHIKFVVKDKEKKFQDDIAIVGISCRFPGGADNPGLFWKNLQNNRDCISDLPAGRWEWPSYINTEKDSSIARGGFINNIDCFDNLFFNISPREAELMDPQQRILLELSWKTFEDGGYKISELAGSNMGVFIAASGSDYNNLLNRHLEPIEAHYSTGTFMTVLPNRISFFYNLKGKSMLIDTACSSSLVAVHEALESIYNGSCDQALVGGINVMCDPATTISFYKAGMLSKDGKCKTFDKSADGYVRGEGAGMIILKPLEKACADGNKIYGIIKGSSVNHGGRAASLTVPNPGAQADLLCAAYQKAGIDAGTVGYIEAHGTGTSLGDPVEIKGLKMAFNKMSPERKSSGVNPLRCGIGSVKTNIGHLEAAAGMAGLIKLLLCFKHKTVPASLNYEELNPHINLEDSPFFVVKDQMEWRAVETGEGLSLPRRGGVSSFGFGGVNAHVVLEEYRGAQVERREAPGVQLILLSARTEWSLRQNVKSLYDYLNNDTSSSSLEDIAYTLQCAREEMDERLALLAGSKEELCRSLKRILEDSAGAEKVFRGNVKNMDLIQSLFFDDDTGKEAVYNLAVNWFRSGRLDKLAELWINGGEIDWRVFYHGNVRTVVSLPTYSFERKRHWVSKKKNIFFNPGISPFVDGFDFKESMDINEGIVFKKRFRLRDFVLRDHKVLGQSVLPGAVGVEMVFGAVKMVDLDNIFVLKDTFWLRPLIVTDDREVKLVLKKSQRGFSYEIKSLENGQLATYCIGEMEVLPFLDRRVSVDVDALKLKLKKISISDFFNRMEDSGIKYGRYFKALEEAWSSKDEALGILTLKEDRGVSVDGCTVAPSILVGAFQCCETVGAEVTSRPGVPFAIGKMFVYKPPARDASYVYVKKIAEGKYDILITGREGDVCVEIKEYEVRPMKNPLENLLYAPRWIHESLPLDSENQPELAGNTLIVCHSHCYGLESRIVEDCNCYMFYPGKKTEKKYRSGWTVNYGNPRDIVDCLKVLPEIDKIYFLQGLCDRSDDLLDPDVLKKRQEYGVLTFFRLVKALISCGYSERQLGIVVLTQNCHRIKPGGRLDPGGAGLVGFTKSMAKEFIKWKIKSIDFEEKDLQHSGAIKKIIEAEPCNPEGNNVCYRQGLRYVSRLTGIKLPGGQNISFRKDGVYVILGGAGGIGLVLSEYIVKKYNARLVWLGRRGEDDRIRESIKQISKNGPAPWYIQTDAADFASLAGAVKSVKEKYFSINGVIHSAVVLNDQSLRNMTEEQFLSVQEPKTTGSIMLGRVFENEKLDWLCFFSSVQSFIGTAGLSNYAAGCSFKDAYAGALMGKVNFPVYILNWGFWGSVGVASKEKYRRIMAGLGIYSVEPDEGIQTVEALLTGGFRQVVCMKIAESAMSGMGFESDISLVNYSEDTPSIFSGVLNRIPDRSQQLKEVIRKERTADKALNNFLIKGLITVMSRAGFFDLLLKHRDTETVRTELGVIEKYNRLYNEIIRILTTEKIISGSNFLPASVEEVDFSAMVPEYLIECPQLKAHFQLLVKCLDAMPEIIRGKRLSTDIIFPEASMALVEGIYKGNDTADFLNGRVADIVAAYVQNKLLDDHHSGTIRILEIGAGTGGTSGVVFDCLKPFKDHVEYMYTDISRSFLLFAEEKFYNNNPYIKFALFDVEKNIEDQKISRNYYDIVLATNVLHATAKIDRTLEQVKGILKARGLLVLNEITSVKNFLTLTFGLLDGWWCFVDEDIRLPGSPCLSSGNWKNVLECQGFRKVTCVDKEAAELGQEVILAESSGQNCVIENLREAREKSGNKKISVKESSSGINAGKKKAKPVGLKSYMIKDPEACLEELVIKKVAEALKMPEEEISLDEQFSDYGIDSILGVNLINNINETLDIDLHTTDIFSYTNVSSLSRHIWDEYKERILLFLESDAGAPGILSAEEAPATREDDDWLQDYEFSNISFEQALDRLL